MRRLYAKRQANFIRLCRELGRLDLGHREQVRMQLLAKFKQPLSDREAVAAALEEGLDVQGISINYHSTAPQQGLLLGYAALDERQILRAVLALRAISHGYADSRRCLGSGCPRLSNFCRSTGAALRNSTSSSEACSSATRAAASILWIVSAISARCARVGCDHHRPVEDLERALAEVVGIVQPQPWFSGSV